jgi:hypothetical protein
MILGGFSISTKEDALYSSALWTISERIKFFLEIGMLTRVYHRSLRCTFWECRSTPTALATRHGGAIWQYFRPLGFSGSETLGRAMMFTYVPMSKRSKRIPIIVQCTVVYHRDAASELHRRLDRKAGDLRSCQSNRYFRLDYHRCLIHHIRQCLVLLFFPDVEE